MLLVCDTFAYIFIRAGMVGAVGKISAFRPQGP